MPRKPRFEAVFGAVRLVVAGVIVAAFGGLLLTVVSTQPPGQDTAPAVGGTASNPPPSTILFTPTPDAVPSPTTAASPTPIGPAPPVTTTKFVRPFEYSIPNGISPSATYEDNEVFTLVVARRVPAGGVTAPLRQSAGECQGERDLRGARDSHRRCDRCGRQHLLAREPASPYGGVGHGPAEFLNSLDEIGGLRLEGQGATTFGGRPAIAASSVWSRCAQTEIIIGTRPIWEAYARLEIPSRIIVAEVGDSTVMAQIWAGNPIDLEEWLPKAQEFIDSMTFLEDGEVAPASPSTVFASVIGDRQPGSLWEPLHRLGQPLDRRAVCWMSARQRRVGRRVPGVAHEGWIRRAVRE